MLQGCLPMSLANDHELERVAYLQADKHKGLNISLNVDNKSEVIYIDDKYQFRGHIYFFHDCYTHGLISVMPALETVCDNESSFPRKLTLNIRPMMSVTSVEYHTPPPWYLTSMNNTYTEDEFQDIHFTSKIDAVNDLTTVFIKQDSLIDTDSGLFGKPTIPSLYYNSRIRITYEESGETKQTVFYVF